MRQLGGLVEQRTGRFDLRVVVHGAMLKRLKRADRPAELDTDTHVIERPVGCRLHEAEQFGGEREIEHDVDLALQRLRGRAARQHDSAGERCAVQNHLAQHGAVDGDLLDDTHAGTVARNVNQRGVIPDRSVDDKSRRGRGRWHGDPRAGQACRSFVGDRLFVAGGGACERRNDQRLAGDRVRQQVRWKRRCAVRERDDAADRGRERKRGQGGTQLLGDEAQFGQSEPAAAVVGREQQAKPAGRRGFFELARQKAARQRPQTPHARPAAEAAAERLHALPKQRLLFIQQQVHGDCSRACTCQGGERRPERNQEEGSYHAEDAGHVVKTAPAERGTFRMRPRSKRARHRPSC